MVDEQMGFGWEAAPPGPLPRAAALHERLRRLAAEHIYIGTSSWKYPGWLGQIYNEGRYCTRGRFSQRKFEHECLAEYAGVFPTVGGDFTFYQFPSEAMWHRTFEQLPAGYRFSLKVPEELTAYRYSNHARYGPRAGMINGHFMDAGLLAEQLLGPLERYSDKLGTIMFEFGTIHEGPCVHADAFAAQLDDMLGALPRERFRFAVEVRNRNFVYRGSPYLACLSERGVAHCLNNWTAMPNVDHQLDVPGILTAPHVAARFLLKPGRTYQQAVEQFSPYTHVKEVYPEGRAALRRLIVRCREEQLALFAFVNNRFEGNAVETIEAVLDSMNT